MDEKLLRCLTPDGPDGYKTGGESLPGGVCFGPEGEHVAEEPKLGNARDTLRYRGG